MPEVFNAFDGFEIAYQTGPVAPGIGKKQRSRHYPSAGADGSSYAHPAETSGETGDTLLWTPETATSPG